jgi:predicted TIM-barrel fold metal-dependent hydrolase
MNGRLQDGAPLGSDHPFMPVDRSLSDFEAVGPEPNVVEDVLDRNARHILRLKT